MNIISWPSAIESRLEEASSNLITGCPLYDVTNDNLYIKKNDDLVLLGGNGKQNTLLAGENIEIIDDSVIQTKDDIIVDTITIETSDHNNPKWKASIKLGELNNGNKIFLLVKETDILSNINGLIGGDLIIKMDTDIGEKFAEYSFTLSSNGSWNIQGASEVSENVRICKVNYNGESYYGLKIPNSSFIEEEIIDNPTYRDNETQTTTYLQYCEDRSLTLGYTGQGYSSPQKLDFEEHLRDEGSVSIDRYSVSVRQLVDNLNDESPLWRQSVSSIDVLDNKWRTWYNEDKKFDLEVWSESKIGYPIMSLRKVGLGLQRTGATNNYQGVFRLARINVSSDAVEAYTNITYRGVAEGGNGGTYLSTYNRWYTCAVSNFNNLFGFTLPAPLGTTYNNNNYHICFRIYYNNQNRDTRITKIMVVDDRSRVQTSNNRIHWNIIAKDANGRNLEWEANDPDLPLKNINTNLLNILDPPVYANFPNTTGVQPIGTFISNNYSATLREYLEISIPKVEMEGEDSTNILDYMNLCDKAYVERTPDHNLPALFKPWEYNDNLCLLYTNIGWGANTYTFFADFLNSFTEITSHNYTTTRTTRNIDINKTDIYLNGWDLRDASLIPDLTYTDSALNYQVLADTSTEDTQFTEIINIPPTQSISNTLTTISDKEKLGEDAAPYKIILTSRVLTLSDLTNLANILKEPDRQISLDLSDCTLADDARRWRSQTWLNCTSLRELIVPSNLLSIESNCFLWCTYLRNLDLSPATNIQVLGSSQINGNNLGSDNISDTWAQYSGTFTSTRVRTLLIPKSINTFSSYLTYSSNIKNMIMLHTNTQNWPRCSQRTFGGTDGYGDIYSGCLPMDFHLFVEQGFNNRRPANGSYTNGTGWNNNNGWYTRDVINSIVVFNKDWNQSEWQTFNNTYGWGEDLINRVRFEFGKTDSIEIQ